jgi:hypothetical protein
MSIPFTQYKRPTGRAVPVTIDRPAEIEALALKVFEAGGRFECEVFRTGEVSFEAVRQDGLLASEIAENGPRVADAVDRLVRTAAERLPRACVERGADP